MNNHSSPFHPTEEIGSLKSYIIGFALSILLTLIAYFLVVEHVLTYLTLIFTIVGLATVQTVVQLVFFLHLGQEPKPHMNSLIFSVMGVVILILVIGSLWIMFDLDNRVMAPMEFKDLQHQE